MITRAMIEVTPKRLEMIKIIADRCGMKQKRVTERLLKFAFFKIKEVFPDFPNLPETTIKTTTQTESTK